MKELSLPCLKLRFKHLGGETKEEVLILGVLKGDTLYIDKIIEKTKLEASTVVSTLAIMKIKGKVRNLGGNIYALKH